MKQGSDPHSGAIVSHRAETFKTIVKQLICGNLKAMRIRQSLPQPYINQAEMRVSWKVR